MLRATRYLGSLIAALIAVGLIAAPAMGAQADLKRYIVVLEDSVRHPAAIARTQTRQHHGKLGFIYYADPKGYSAGLEPEDVEALRRDPRVRYITVDHKFEAFGQQIPTGIARTLATQNPSLDIDGSDDVRIDADVAVIDSGIDQTHPDLAVVQRTDCSNGTEFSAECVDGVGTDESGHGTHVAGTVGAIDNQAGVVGIAPGVRLWSVRAIGHGFTFESEVVAAVKWVTSRAGQIEVANMSLGCQCESPALEDAVSASVEKGVVYVVASGNNAGSAAGVSPASNPDVISVGALGDNDGATGGAALPTCDEAFYSPPEPRYATDDRIAKFSNTGASIAAPGVCILSTLPGEQYGSMSGTSMASPHVAGAAAILASRSNPASKADVEAIRTELVTEAEVAEAEGISDAEGRGGGQPLPRTAALSGEHLWHEDGPAGRDHQGALGGIAERSHPARGGESRRQRNQIPLRIWHDS